MNYLLNDLTFFKKMIVKAWLARDNDGDLYMHFAQPVEDYVSLGHWRSRDYVNVSKTLLDKAFIEIEPSSEPIEIEIKSKSHD